MKAKRPERIWCEMRGIASEVKIALWYCAAPTKVLELLQISLTPYANVIEEVPPRWRMRSLE